MRKNFDETGTAGTFTGYVEIVPIPKFFLKTEQIYNITGVVLGNIIDVRNHVIESDVMAEEISIRASVEARLKELSIAAPKEKTFTEKLNELGYI